MDEQETTAPEEWVPTSQKQTAPPAKTWTAGTLTYTRGGLVVLFFLLLAGDLVWALRDRSIGPITQLLFKNHGASDFFNGLMLSSVPTVIGMVLGPIISYRSDRYRSKLGRRIPFLFVTTPVVLIGMLGMSFSKWLGPELQLLVPSLSADQAALWVLGGAWIFFEFGVLIASVVFFALINDVVPSTLLGRFFGLFRIVSLLVGIGFNYMLFGYAEQHHEVVFAALAIIYAVGITLMCCFVREGEYPPVEHGTSRRSNLKIAFEYLKNCSKSPYYWLLFSMLIVTGLVWLPGGTFIAFYAKSLNIDMDYYGRLGAYSYVISLLLAYPLGVWVDRFHPLRCVMVVVSIHFVTSLLSGIFVHDQLTFTVAFIVQTVMAGSYWTVSAPLTMRLFPRAQFAQYGIVGGLLGGILNAFAVPLLGKFLDYSGHQYVYTFYMAAAVSFVSIVLLFAYYRKFQAYGGVKNYVAPEF